MSKICIIDDNVDWLGRFWLCEDLDETLYKCLYYKPQKRSNIKYINTINSKVGSIFDPEVYGESTGQNKYPKRYYDSLTELVEKEQLDFIDFL